jgi:hypothetical protein
MPAYKTMNEDRNLTLLYSSAAANPQYQLPLRVMIPAGTLIPDSVRVTLNIGSLSWVFNYLGSSFVSGETRRLTLSFDASTLPFGTGLYAYSALVSNIYGSTIVSADTVRSELVVVDRKRVADAPYGIGWAVAGVSELRLGRSGRNALVIVEAEGSYITYDSVAGNTYRAAAGNYRDSVFYGSFDPGDSVPATYYLQRDKDQTSSYYDTSGRLRWVVEKSGQRAEFRYDGTSSRLAAILAAPWSLGRIYTFAYSCGQLDSIMDPAGRTLNVSVDASRHLTSLLDPGLTQPTSLGYSTAGLLTTWTSPRNHTFTYKYFGGRGILTAVIQSPGTDSVSFVPSQLPGLALAGNAQPVPAASDTAKTVIRGARAIGDTVVFHVTKYGSPSKIVDAMGNVTTITRANGALNMLPTRITFPNGSFKSIGYDSRGNVSKLRMKAPIRRMERRRSEPNTFMGPRTIDLCQR